eukprot:m.13469 g.13469  ORF g.13469 m.13469 type:complete len:817 (+) comp3305_c0_seq1:148-2598(+)
MALETSSTGSPSGSMRRRRGRLGRVFGKLASLRKTGDMPLPEEEEEDGGTADLRESFEHHGALDLSGVQHVSDSHLAVPAVSSGFGRSSTAPAGRASPTPSRCRHDYAHTPEATLPKSTPGDFLQSEHAIHGIRIYLKRGENLISCDSNGASDPFCKFNIGKYSKHTSDVCKATLNPIWGEEFFMACPPTCVEKLSLTVMDKDFIGQDFMGAAEIEIATLQLNETRELTVRLVDNRRKTSKLPAELGFIHLTLTKTFTSSKKDLRSRKKENLSGSRLITVDVIEARDLCPLDDNGLADPYVKVKIGQKTLKTKSVSKTLSPCWKQRLEFQVHDESQIVSFHIFDRIAVSDDLFLGQCDLDMRNLAFETTHAYWLPVNDVPELGELHVMVTICDLYAESSSIRMTEAEKAKYPAMLRVKIISGRSLIAKDLNGKSDPFVVLQLGNTRLRTLTQKKTLNPTWNKVFEIPVMDIFDVIDLAVYDEDKRGKEFMGALQIPLLELPKGPTWFPLKGKKLLKRLEGDIQLDFQLHYKPIPAFQQLIKRRTERHMEEEETFSIRMLTLNATRVKNIAFFVVNTVQAIDGLFKWEFGFAKSFFAMLAWIVLCLFCELWMFPLLIAAWLGYTWLFWKKSRSVDESGMEVFDEDDDEEDDSASDQGNRPSTGGRGPAARLQQMKSIGLTIQVALDQVASLGERVKNLVNWSVPLITKLLCAGLIVASFVLYLVPLRYLLLVVGTKKFIKKGLNRYQPFGLFELPKGWLPTNEALELLGRVPSDIERAQRLRLVPKGMAARRERVQRAALRSMSSDGSNEFERQAST